MIKNMTEQGVRQAIDQLQIMRKYVEVRERQATQELAKAELDVNTFRSMLGWADHIKEILMDRLNEINEMKDR